MDERASPHDDRHLRVERFARSMIGCFGPGALSVARKQVHAAKHADGAVRASWTDIAGKIAELQAHHGADDFTVPHHLAQRDAPATCAPSRHR